MQNAAISFPMLGSGFSVNPPVSFQVFGIRVFYYGVITAIAFVIGAIYDIKRSRDFGLTEDNILDLVIIAVPSAVIGARILFVITNPDQFFGPGKWSEIPKIWHGGLAIYGGLVLAVIGILIYSKKKKLSFGALLDGVALGLMLGQVIGRWGNFINRELYGTETDVFCRMGLTLDGKTTYVHPVFLYESLWNLVGFVILHFISKKYRKFKGQMFLMYIAWYGLGRTFIDGLRIDVVKLFGGTIGAYQFIALITFCAASIILVLLLSKYRDRPCLTCTPTAEDETSDDKEVLMENSTYIYGENEAEIQLSGNSTDTVDPDINNKE